MERINFNKEWEFCKEAPSFFFILNGMKGKEIVNLPHDAGITEAPKEDCPDGSQVGFLKGQLALYTKYFEAPLSWKNKRIILELDGAYCNTEIVLNGHQIAIHPNGYAPFDCDLTDYLYIGEKNRLTIFCNNSMQYTARWYSGTGIYRDVFLRVAPKVHLSINPIFATTEWINKNQASIKVEVDVENHTSEIVKTKVKVKLHKDYGRKSKQKGRVASEAEGTLLIDPCSKGKALLKLIVNNAKLWDVENPNLYNIFVDLLDVNNRKLDSDETLLGIRTISIDVKNGLRLNGKTIKLKGGCVHHDNGILGAASFYDSEYRRLQAHKDNGYNAIRCAHNPMSANMMEACDRLGLLVFAEAFDVWTMQKNMNDYHSYFEDWWERDLTAFIKRDRNHPSIFCWSIGNEVGERNSLKGGAEYSKKLADKARELDFSRSVTSAVPTMFNGMDDKDTIKQLGAMKALGGPAQNLSTPWSEEVWADRTEDYCALLDFVGYNYLEFRYERDALLYPDRVICGTESYPANIDIIWNKILNNNHLIGDFVWTSHDYLGETGCGIVKYTPHDAPSIGRSDLQRPSFPQRTANCSDFDITSKDMPALHYRKIVWGSDETYIAVMNPKNFGMRANKTAWAWADCDNTWLWDGYENIPITIEVYSAAEEVELIINDKLIGKEKTNRFKANFDTIYNPGVITAISYIGGKEISRQTLTTPKKATKLVAIPDRTILNADGESLAFVEIYISDDEGNRITNAEVKLTAKAGGVAKLEAFG